MFFKLLRTGISLLMILTLSMVAAPDLSVSAEGSDGFVPNEVVLKLVQISDLNALAAEYGLHPLPLDQFGTRAIFRMSILDGTAPEDKAAELIGDPRLVYAEPNFIGQAPEARQRVSWAKGDESLGDAGEWAAIMIRLPEAHTVTRGAGITVAVLDTGVDLSHPALAGRLVHGYDFVDQDTVPAEEGSQEENIAYGHGTHVAGLVALAAPEAKIMPVRMMDPDGLSNIWVLAEAMAYASNPDDDPETDDGVDVINLSLSTTRQTHLLADIGQEITCTREVDDDDSGSDDADAASDDMDNDDDDNDNDDINEGSCPSGNGQNGVVIVASAGNSSSSCPEYPAAEGFSGLLSVGASAPSDSLASFSNYGGWVHVTAPGQSILSSIPGGEYAFWSGTSMAAPLAAGQAALVRSAYPRLDAADVVDRIRETSYKINGPVPLRIDAASALGIPLMDLNGEYRCSGVLGPVTADNLLIDPGQTCMLVGTRVRGNIKLEGAQTLTAIGLHLNGSIQAKQAESINIIYTNVDGSIQIEAGGSARLRASRIDGSVEFIKNVGSLWISDNRIGGNLQCKENTLEPEGGSNLVQGNKEGQCMGL